MLRGWGCARVAEVPDAGREPRLPQLRFSARSAGDAGNRAGDAWAWTVAGGKSELPKGACPTRGSAAIVRRRGKRKTASCSGCRRVRASRGRIRLCAQGPSFYVFIHWGMRPIPVACRVRELLATFSCGLSEPVGVAWSIDLCPYDCDIAVVVGHVAVHRNAVPIAVGVVVPVVDQRRGGLSRRSER